MAEQALDCGAIFDRLSEHSSRPRYAFMVLNLLAEQAGADNRAGPVINDGGMALPLREWIGHKLSRASSRKTRRDALVRRIRQSLSEELPDDLIEAQKIVDAKVEMHVRSVGADNASRVIVDLERAGLLKRHYQGYRTNHRNRGGLRQLVCVLDGDAVAALRRRDTLI